MDKKMQVLTEQQLICRLNSFIRAFPTGWKKDPVWWDGHLPQDNRTDQAANYDMINSPGPYHINEEQEIDKET